MARSKSNDIKYLTQKELWSFFKVIEKSKDNIFYKINKDWKKIKINRPNFWLRDLTMFHLWYYCWLRSSEIWLLKLENYNQHKWEIFVKRLKWSLNNTIRLDQTRTKLLNKYIKEYSWDAIYEIKSDYDYLFKSKNWSQLNFNTIFWIFKEYAKKTQIDINKLHPHTLKHSIAVHLAESGIDIKDLQYYLGHKSILNTQIYFQYTTKQLDSMYEKLSKNNVIV